MTLESGEKIISAPVSEKCPMCGVVFIVDRSGILDIKIAQ